MTVAFVALGSNQDDRAAHLQAAVDGLVAAAGVQVVAASRVYETDPVGGPVQDDFLNAVLRLETTLDARALLGVGQALEQAAGREPDPARRRRWGPRPLDVDVLDVEGERCDEPDLVVPHPRLEERAFVLAPLEDLAPDHPAVRAGRSRFPDGWPGVRVADVELRLEGGA